MKKIFCLTLMALSVLSVAAQSEDPVVMKINGKSITRSEFEYSFNKNNSDGVLDKKDVKDYVQLFVDFKLKVIAAEDAGFDTLPSIKKELAGYREQIVMPTIVDEDFIERKAKETYDNTAARFGGEDLLKASHILIRLDQNATAEQQVAAKAKIDSIYAELLKGADFAEMAKAFSDDKGSAQRGGDLGQFGKGMMIPDFENAAYALKKGEMSKPFLSVVGYHIVKVNDRHPFEPYEFHHDNIIKFLEARGIKEASANALLDSLSKKQGVGRAEVVDSLCDVYLSQNAEARFLSQEYYDGTLMYEISKANIWDKAARDDEGLASHFASNKKKYAWKEPRFCGIIVHAKNDSIQKLVKKALKGVKEEDWSVTLVKAFNNDSVKNVRIERGIYKKGDSGYVDYLVFKTGEEKHMKDFASTAVYGKKCKKPRNYKDVKGAVTTDYQNRLEKEWVESLRSKYKVEVDESVLSTVNNH
jgi:peptidyl-prolyl cis-trans isomerase SurA